MPRLYTDNARSTLAASLAAIDTTLTVATGEGARFPATGGGNTFKLTLVDDAAEPTIIEVVECTSRTGDVLTITRAQDGTSAVLWASATVVVSGATASSLNDIQTALDGKQPLDADLTALAGLTSAADCLPYFTGSTTAALAQFTSFGRTLAAVADASEGRTALGLVIGTDVAAFSSLASYLPLAGGTMTGTITSTLGTLAGASTPALSATQTWNNAATTFRGLLLNVTNTASNAASTLIDLQLGGTSLFKVNRAGNVFVGTGSFRDVGSGQLRVVRDNGADILGLEVAGLRITGTQSVNWSTSFAVAVDTAITRTAAGVIEINNGTPSTFRDAIMRNLFINGVGSIGGGVGVVGMLNATTVPTSNPTGGGVLYAEGGALKWRGSSGTITTIAAA